MPKLTLTGHPLHPQMVSGPIGLIPTAFAFDLLYFITRDKRYADASYLSLVAAEAYGVGAALAGLADYLSLPVSTPVKRTGTLHGVLNAGVLGLTAAAIARRRKRRTPDAASILLGAATNVLLTFSAWYGGELVYNHGARVVGRDPLKDAPEIRPPHDKELLEAPFVRLQDLADSILTRGEDGE